MPLATAVGQTGTLNWVHGHHLGTPILTTNAAGQAITPTGTAILGFPGQFANALLLSGAQHYYNRYRDYNFATGRYIQADPIGLAGDDNPYAYAAGNPLKYIDPAGLAPVCNFSSRPVLVGGTAGGGHGHPVGGDQWVEYVLQSGQCVSRWEPKKKSDCPDSPTLADVDTIDLNGDGKVKWPGTNGFGPKFLEYTFGEAFRGSDTASGPFNPLLKPVENQFVVLRDKPKGGRTWGFEKLGAGLHGR